MPEFESLSADKQRTVAEIRARIHNEVHAIVALGDGGWNHGAKLMRFHADAMYQLKSAEALLVEGSSEDS